MLRLFNGTHIPPISSVAYNSRRPHLSSVRRALSSVSYDAVALDTNCVTYLALAYLSLKYTNRDRQRSIMNLQNSGLSDVQLDNLLTSCRELNTTLRKKVVVVGSVLGSAVRAEYYSAPAVSFKYACAAVIDIGLISIF